MTTIPMETARTRSFGEVMDDVDHGDHVEVVAAGGRVTYVVVTGEEWASIKETLEIISDPEQAAEMAEADRDIAEGNTMSAEDFDEVMRRRLASKS